MAGSKAPKLRRPRHRYPIAEKRRIVELTLRQGASARAIAREYGISHNSLCRWRALYRAGRLEGRPSRVRADVSPAQFLPVTVAPAVRTERIARANGFGSSIVQLSLPSGATLRIETGELDVATVCAFIDQLQR